jgi:hypothetical protein
MEINTDSLTTVRNYALQMGKTTQWAYDQVKKKKVKSVEIDGVKFIVK